MNNAEMAPACVGIIMDGNRRWAKAKGAASLEGHAAGYENAKAIIRHAFARGVGTIIVYAFSTENWNRSAGEVNYLMQLFARALESEFAALAQEGVRIRFIGDLAKLSPELRAAAEKLEAESAANAPGKTLAIALSYGGRAEITAAVNALMNAGKTAVTEANIAGALWTAGLPDPDLIIRTSGEERLSNFLPWQSTYSELFFTPTLWPDFSPEEFDRILAEYAERERRHGR